MDACRSKQRRTRWEPYIPRWESMSDDLLRLIFQRLRHERDLFSVAWVCKSWQSACPDVFMWRGDTLDLDRFSSFFKQPQRFSKLLRKAMEQGEKRCKAAVCITFPSYLFLSPEDFIFLAKRTPRVKILNNLRTHLIDKEGFAEGSQYWKEIREAHIMSKLGSDIDTKTYVVLNMHRRRLKSLSVFNIN